MSSHSKMDDAFQQANWLNINWKQELPPHQKSQWITWLLNMNQITHLEVPRYITPKRFDESEADCHAFDDASENVVLFTFTVLIDTGRFMFLLYM